MLSTMDLKFPMPHQMSNDTDDQDFPLYPEPPMYSPPLSYAGMQTVSMESNRSYVFPGEQETYPSSSGFNNTSLYADAPQFSLESPELRSATSNYSTASGPSVASSTVGSPHSLPGQNVPVPEWSPVGLGMTPSIVQYDSFGQSADYSFTSGMDDFAIELNASKTGFVGECESVPRSQKRSSISNSETFLSFSTHAPLSTTSTSTTPPITPPSSKKGFNSPISSFSTSPILRRDSQAYKSAISLPHSAGLTSTAVPSPASQFFSQSNGNYIPPLQSSCWFPLSNALICLHISNIMG